MVRISNCHDDLLAFHASRIALPQHWHRDLQRKREHLRQQIREGLDDDFPTPSKFCGQGSFAMRTIIRGGNHGSYDIDDGIYFTKASLVGKRGAPIAPLAIRKAVRDAADHANFNDPPEVKTNCVRVYYAGDYHVDIPVYRASVGPDGEPLVELAASVWRRTDPQGVTAWFVKANARSPGRGANTQLRRIVQYLKTWSKARAQTQGRMLGGFGITVLAVEAYRRRPERDDRALYETLVAIRQRLRNSTIIAHPVLDDETVPRRGDAAVRVFRDCLNQSLDKLDGLTHDYSRAAALRLWDGFFNETFFREQPAIR